MLRLAAGQHRDRIEILVFSGVDIETQNALRARVVRPDFSVEILMQRHHVELRVVLVALGRHGEIGEPLGLRIELGEGGLIHHAHPKIAVLVGIDVEVARRPARLENLHLVFGGLARRHVELAEELLAEVRVIDRAVEHDHVVRLDGFARQVVFGDDDMRAPALHARHCL